MSRKRRPGRTPPRNPQPKRLQALVDLAVADVSREAGVSDEVARVAVSRALRVMPAIAASLSGRSTPDDPLGVAGSMVDDPFTLGGVTMDATNAVLLEGLEVAHVDIARADDEPVAPFVIAALLEGRINNRAEMSRVLYLLGVDHAAAIIAELWKCAERAGRYPLLMELTRDRVREIDAEEAAARAAAGEPEGGPNG